MDKTIILIEDFYDKKKILNLQKQHSNSKIFSVNYKTHKFLEKSNIPHLIGDDLLTELDKKSIDHDGLELCKNWYFDISDYSSGTYIIEVLPEAITYQIVKQ